jgi:hypothetical protein
MNILDFIRDYTVSDGLGGRKLKVTTTGGQTDESIYTQSDPLGGRFIKVSLSGGGGSSITVVDDYLDLPLPGTVTGQFYWCENSTGTPFIGALWGGTYYPAGLYYSNGVSWSYMDTPAQATQSQVNAGTVTDQWVSPSTLRNSTQWNDYVPYTGATEDVDLGANNISARHGVFSTSVSINGEDTMIVNGSAITSKLSINGEDGITEAEIEMHRHSATAASGTSIYGARSRGAIGAETIVQDGDRILSITGVGYDGTDYSTSAQIDFEVDGTPGSNDMPGRIVFKTSPDGSQTLTERMRISQNGDINIAGLTASQVVVTDSNKNLVSYAITTAQLAYLAKRLAKTAISAAHTGTTANTYVDGLLIPANTFGAGDIINVKSRVNKSTSVSTYTHRLYVNTTNNLSGSPILIATAATSAAANRFQQVSREIEIMVANGTGAGTEVMSASVGSTQDDVQQTDITTCAINWTVDQYIICAIQLANSGDSIVNHFIRTA